METRDVLYLVATLATVVFGILTYRNGRRGTDISEQTYELNRLNAVEKRASDLEDKLTRANDTIDALQRKLRVTTELADQATAEWQALHKLIWRPGMTLDRLKDYVGPPTPEETRTP